MTMQRTLRDVAREALASHDALRAAKDLEPDCNDDGIPYDAGAWLTWRHNVSVPAYNRWSTAMDDLASALGEPEMSRHPFNFRPRAEAIVGDA